MLTGRLPASPPRVAAALRLPMAITDLTDALRCAAAGVRQAHVFPQMWSAGRNTVPMPTHGGEV